MQDSLAVTSSDSAASSDSAVASQSEGNSAAHSDAPVVALLDYGSGNLRSAQRALERAGAQVIVTSDPKVVLAADGLLVPGVGAYGACMKGLRSIHGDRMIGQMLAGGRGVLGICVGMQILFERGMEFGADAACADSVDSETAETAETDTDAQTTDGTEGCGEWPGSVDKLDADVLPHMGWNTVEVEENSTMFAGIEQERFYFVHSYAAQQWELTTDGRTEAPRVHWAHHGRSRFIAAVENGPLWATQFHPEKSGDAGAQLLKNWIATLTRR